jgi:hypothetical protein
MSRTLLDLEQLEADVRTIPWYSASSLTAQAESLAGEHVRRMRNVFEFLKPKNHSDAYSDAQSAGYDAPNYGTFMQRLFKLNYGSAPAKEPLILTLISDQFWSEDRDLCVLENPWEPLVQLYRLGFTSTYDEDEAKDQITVVLEYPGARKMFPVA